MAIACWPKEEANPGDAVGNKLELGLEGGGMVGAKEGATAIGIAGVVVTLGTDVAGSWIGTRKLLLKLFCGTGSEFGTTVTATGTGTLPASAGSGRFA